MAEPPALVHHYGFDPAYGYDLAGLLDIAPPPEPADFAAFWQARYARARAQPPCPQLQASAFSRPGFTEFDLQYQSTDAIQIGGWLLVPQHCEPQRAFVCGHGYGGINAPDADLPCDDAVYLFPCLRGISRSRHPPISDNPAWHVLHDIDKRDRYVLGGCVEDVWLAVSALLELYPDLAGQIGYMGISFSGGIGALALPWDARIRRAHLNVPTFGNQPLRLRLPSTGSAAAVQAYAAQHRNVADTLAYYDAAIAARHIRQPVLVAAALFDPVVAPPGQFTIYNALAGPRELFVLRAGHFEYPERDAESSRLLTTLGAFFGCNEP